MGKQVIVWAVDAFEKSTDALSSAAWTIRALTKGNQSKVYPVYAWGGSTPEMIPEPSQWSLKGIRHAAQDRIESTLTRIKIPGIQPIHVPPHPSLGIRDGVREVLAYAKRRKADLLVVSTQGKKGLKRLALGSFAETLALHSEIPMITVRPNWRRTPDLGTILFATDLSEQSKEAFARVQDFAARFNSRIVLFHKVNFPEYPVVEFALKAVKEYPGAYDAVADSLELEANRWADRARSRGLKVDVIIDRSRVGTPAEAALKKAKRMNALIALVSQSGPISATLLGSTTRQILRNSEQPVWVLHPVRTRKVYETKEQDIERDLFKAA